MRRLKRGTRARKEKEKKPSYSGIIIIIEDYSRIEINYRDIFEVSEKIVYNRALGVIFAIYTIALFITLANYLVSGKTVVIATINGVWLPPPQMPIVSFWN